MSTLTGNIPSSKSRGRFIPQKSVYDLWVYCKRVIFALSYVMYSFFDHYIQS
eukprot:UN20595